MDVTRSFFDILWQDEAGRTQLQFLVSLSDDVYSLEDNLKRSLDLDGEWEFMHTRTKPYEGSNQYWLAQFIGHIVGNIRYDELAKLVWRVYQR